MPVTTRSRKPVESKPSKENTSEGLEKGNTEANGNGTTQRGNRAAKVTKPQGSLSTTLSSSQSSQSSLQSDAGSDMGMRQHYRPILRVFEQMVAPEINQEMKSLKDKMKNAQTRIKSRIEEAKANNIQDTGVSSGSTSSKKTTKPAKTNKEDDIFESSMIEEPASSSNEEGTRPGQASKRKQRKAPKRPSIVVSPPGRITRAKARGLATSKNIRVSPVHQHPPAGKTKRRRNVKVEKKKGVKPSKTTATANAKQPKAVEKRKRVQEIELYGPVIEYPGTFSFEEIASLSQPVKKRKLAPPKAPVLEELTEKPMVNVSMNGRNEDQEKFTSAKTPSVPSNTVEMQDLDSPDTSVFETSVVATPERQTSVIFSTGRDREADTRPSSRICEGTFLVNKPNSSQLGRLRDPSQRIHSTGIPNATFVVPSQGKTFGSSSNISLNGSNSVPQSQDRSANILNATYAIKPATASIMRGSARAMQSTDKITEHLSALEGSQVVTPVSKPSKVPILIEKRLGVSSERLTPSRSPYTSRSDSVSSWGSQDTVIANLSKNSSTGSAKNLARDGGKQRIVGSSKDKNKESEKQKKELLLQMQEREDQRIRRKEQNIQEKVANQKRKNEEWKQKVDKIKEKDPKSALIWKPSVQDEEGKSLGKPSPTFAKTVLASKLFGKTALPANHKVFGDGPVGVGSCFPSVGSLPRSTVPGENPDSSAEDSFVTADGTLTSINSLSTYDITLYEDLDAEELTHRENKHIPRWAQDAEKLNMMLFIQQPDLMDRIKHTVFPQTNIGFKFFTSGLEKTD